MNTRSKYGLLVALAALGVAAPAQAAPVKEVPVLKPVSTGKYQLTAKWVKLPQGTRWIVIKRFGR